MKNLNYSDEQRKMEVNTDEQEFLPNNYGVFGQIDKSTNEIRQQTNRFNSPLGFFDRLNANLKNKIKELADTDSSNQFSPKNYLYPVPIPWQNIISFLYAKGIINSPRISFGRPLNDVPNFFASRLVNRLDSEPTDGKINDLRSYGRGVSLNFEEAISKTIGEALERYPLTIYRRRNFIRASMSNLAKSKKNFLNIHKLAGFAEWQKGLFPKRKFDDQSNFFWAAGKEILSDKTALIPAQLVFWNYDVSQEPSEPYLREPNTNGAAGHFTVEEAILSGIYENIQRDAFLIHWLNSIPPQKIDQNTAKDDDLRHLITLLNRYNFEVVLLNTSLDIPIFSCVCILLDKSGVGPQISIGGGCEPNQEKAMMRSVVEALGIYSWIRTINYSFTLDKEYRPFRDHSIGQEKRMIIWRDKAAFTAIESFISGGKQPLQETGLKTVNFNSPIEELNHVKNIFRDLGNGYEIFVCEAKHEILETLGYHSIKVIIPALVPLYLRENNAPLGSERLKDIPQKLGMKPATDFNPWPHPFP